MPYAVDPSEDRLVVYVKHEPDDRPDDFIFAHEKELHGAREVHFRVWEFDGDSAFVALIQDLHDKGTIVTVSGETARSLAVVRICGFPESRPPDKGRSAVGTA